LIFVIASSFATERRHFFLEIAQAEIWEGEAGCLFDEIGNLVEPTERLPMDVQAGPQRNMDGEASRPGPRAWLADAMRG